MKLALNSILRVEENLVFRLVKSVAKFLVSVQYY